MVTEILAPKDLLGSTKECEEVKAKEINGLLKREAVEVVLEEDVPKEAKLWAAALY